MINTKNYFTEVQKIGVNNLPDTFKKSHELVSKVTQSGSNWNAYNSNETIKRMIDLYFSKLAEYKPAKAPIEKIKEIAKKSEGRVMDVKPDYSEKQKDKVFKDIEKAAKEAFPGAKVIQISKGKNKQQATKPVKTSAKQVERVEDEISLIKRYINFHNKQKTKDHLFNFLKNVQKAILERKASKDSMYGNEIMTIQDSLIKAIRLDVDILDVKIEAKQLEHYTSIVNSVSPMVSVSLIKRYVNLLNKTTKDKAENLIKHFKRAKDKGFVTKNDKYWNQFSFAFDNLAAYLSGKSRIAISEQYLTGFQQIEGLGFIPTMVSAVAAGVAQAVTHHHLTKRRKKGLSGAEPEVMSVQDAKDETFNEIGLTGDYLKLIGRACAPTSIFLYGNGGSGKSGLSLKIADKLHQLNHSVLYAAGEQFGTPTFTELLRKVNITGGANFKIVKTLDTLPIKDFDVIVIDSKESAGIDHSSKFVALRDAYPDKIWIITSQGTKAGNYAGDGKWLNEVDVFVYCENGKATTKDQKNRWGGKETIQLF